jgi:hypothetical protein
MRIGVCGYPAGVAALFFGVIASSASVIGALVGARVRLPKPVIAAMLAFAPGALITALAFELFEDAYEHGGLWRAVLGLSVRVSRIVVMVFLPWIAGGNIRSRERSQKCRTHIAGRWGCPSPTNRRLTGWGHSRSCSLSSCPRAGRAPTSGQGWAVGSRRIRD